MRNVAEEILKELKEYNTILGSKEFDYTLNKKLREKLDELVPLLTPQDHVNNNQILSLIANRHIRPETASVIAEVYKRFIMTEDFAKTYFEYVFKSLQYYENKSNQFSKEVLYYKSEQLDNINGGTLWLKELNIFDTKTCMLIDSGFKEQGSLGSIIKYKGKVEKIIINLDAALNKKERSTMYATFELISALLSDKSEVEEGFKTNLNKLKNRNEKLELLIDKDFKKQKSELIKKIQCVNKNMLYVKKDEINIGSNYDGDLVLPSEATILFKEIKEKINFCLTNKATFVEEELIIIGLIKNKRLDALVESFLKLKEEKGVVNIHGESPEELLLKGLNNINEVLNKYKDTVQEVAVSKNKLSIGA